MELLDSVCLPSICESMDKTSVLVVLDIFEGTLTVVALQNITLKLLGNETVPTTTLPSRFSSKENVDNFIWLS